MSKKPPEFFLHIRNYPDDKMTRGKFAEVSVGVKAPWGWSSLLYGQVSLHLLKPLVERLGLPVEAEMAGAALEQVAPTDHPVNAYHGEQLELFQEEPKE